MASLGSLTVTLGLNAAEFTSGLTKSEYQARKFAQQIDRQVAAGLRVATGAMVAFGAAAAVAFRKAVDDVGNFKQISEQIGDTAEAVAALDKAAATSGVSLNEIASVSARLTATLSKTDDEGGAAAKAIKALGLNFSEFRALSPVAQLEEVARALARFEDGAGKTAVAIALLGKSGAQALPFLNDLADQGGRTVQMTQQQIEAVDRYSKELARLGQELATVARILAADFIKELLRLQAELREGIAIAGGFWNALRLFGTLDPFKDLPEQIRDVSRALEEANSLASQGGFYGFLSRISGNFFGRAADDAKRQLEFLKFQQRQAALSLISDANNDARDLKARQKPALNFAVGGAARGARAVAAKEQISEAQRYLETLDKQIKSTQDLSAVEQARMAIAAGLKGLTPELERQIMLYAEMVDFLREAKDEEANRIKLEQDAARARQQNEQAMARSIDQAFQEAQAIREGNQQAEDQITLLVGGEDALNKVNAARIDSLILLAKEKLLMEQVSGGNALLIKAYEDQIAALERRRQLFDETDIAKKMKEEADKLQDLKDTFSDALVSPLVDFVNQTKSAKDAFKDFARTIQQILTEKAARGVADWIFGGKTQGGFDFSTILKLLSGLFGGGGGTGLLPPGAAGPPMFATGTSFAPGGRAWVGENGPELVDLPRGARVYNAKQSSAMTGRQMVFNVNVLPGADTRSARQAGEALRDVVMRSIRER